MKTNYTIKTPVWHNRTVSIAKFRIDKLSYDYMFKIGIQDEVYEIKVRDIQSCELKLLNNSKNILVYEVPIKKMFKVYDKTQMLLPL